jgi:hypothetical protein
MEVHIQTSYPLGEDWGWFIEYIEGEAELMIGCGSEAEEGEGYKGKPIAWHVASSLSYQTLYLMSRKLPSLPCLRVRCLRRFAYLPICIRNIRASGMGWSRSAYEYLAVHMSDRCRTVGKGRKLWQNEI